MVSWIQLLRRIIFLLYVFWYDIIYILLYGSIDDNRELIIRLKLERCGIIFIKLGQWISQFDKIPKSYKLELSKLQNNCVYHPLTYTLKTIPDNILQQIEISPKPIASGSIGQVYRCRYKDKDCVIKVKHPINENLILDTKIISIISKFYDFTIFDVNTFIESLFLQQDFNKEVENLNTIKCNFSNFDDSILVIPDVLENGENFIIQTYIDGCHMNDCSKKEIIKYKTNLALIYTKMMYVDHFIHGDLHLGNIIITKDNRIGLIDFGLCEKIYKHDIDNLNNLVQSLINCNKSQVHITLLNMGGSRQKLKNPKFIKKLNDIFKFEKSKSRLFTNIYGSIPDILELIKLSLESSKLFKSRILYMLINYSIIVPNGEPYFKDAIKIIVSNWKYCKFYGYSIQPLIDGYQIYD